MSQNLWGKEQWKYNVGYRSQAVDNIGRREEETGYVLGTSYEHELGINTTLIPYFEFAKFDNFSGEEGRSADFMTAAVSLRYSSWNLGVSYLKKDFHSVRRSLKEKDKLFQIYVGYRFSDRLYLDFTRAAVDEYGKKGSIAGFLLSYRYDF